MRTKLALYLLTILSCSSLAVEQAVDPVKKLGAFVGTWQTAGSFAGSDNKISSTLDCRWSPQGIFLVCDQLVSLPGGGDHHQFTAYSYNSKDNIYSYVTIPDPGGKPTSGKIEIKGNLWTYSSSFENNGKTIQIRTTNEFTDPGTEVFKTESSDDGGVTWKTLLQGTAHKTGP
ncbi:MAG TPA: hypothetical protein VKE93_13605 [Candidatus Angelobacter sp.]|nr:hypothetical protein [Candidatus Angelobacter sp.]